MKSSKTGIVLTVAFCGFVFGALSMDLYLNGPSGVEAAEADDVEQSPPIEIDGKVWTDLVPGNNDYGVKLTPMEYVAMIEPILGVPPVVDCGENVEIPIYVDGEPFKGNPGLHNCDNPSLQMGDCMSGGSLGRHEGVTATGDPIPNVVWISYCRHEGRPGADKIENPNSVQMIGYNTETGATAFLESGKNSEWIYTDPETNRMMGRMPGPDDPEAFNRGYTTVGRNQCVVCHQNDPYIHNPYIDAAVMPGTSEPVIPRVRTRNADIEFDNPYYVVGASNWDMRTIHIEGNECLQCHRIGMKTAELFMNNHWHPNEHMPPHDPGSLSEDLQELLDCWKNTPENTPGCDWIVPPAGDALGRVVGDEYPYKRGFNKPKVSYYEDMYRDSDPK
jgi:hypothetical protein